MSGSGGGQFVIVSTIFLIVSAFWFIGGIKTYKLRRLIINTPTSTIRGLAMGSVEVCGQANPLDKPLISPFTKTPCVYYKSVIEQWVQRGKHGSWEKVDLQESDNKFYLEDDTDKVKIDMTDAEIDFPTILCDELKDKNRERFMPIFKERGVDVKGFFFNKKLRLTEQCIPLGMTLYVFGTATRQEIETNDSKGITQTVIGKGDYFYISLNSEKKVLNKLAWQSTGAIIGSSIVFLISLAVLLGAAGAY